MARRLQFESLERRLLLAADLGQLAADLLRQLEVDAESRATGILVRFREPAADSPVIAALQASHGIVSSRSLPLVAGLQRLELPAQAAIDNVLAAFRANPNVLYAEPDYILRTTATPNDPRYSELWGLNNTGQTGGATDVDIDAPEVWDVTTGNPGTVVAVIDTGVDYNHEDLAGNMWVNTAEADGVPGVDDDGNGFIDDIHGYDFANDDGNPMDDQGHGTHVAGTIGAVGNNGIGVVGVNWNVQIMAVKFLAADGTGSTSDAIDAINYAVSMNARISNNSWGGNEPFSQAMYDAIAASQAQDHVFVAGAGNGFFGFPLNNDANPFYPASFDLDNIISVAATDHNNQLASFSNYGATTVDLAAPGVNILSTRPNNNYELLSGTSMATPHVSGVVALVLDQFPNLSYREVIDMVYDNVVPNPVLQGVTVTGGQLNAANVLPPTEAEISLVLDGVEIPDDSAVDIGSALLQVPLQKTFTVRNLGLSDLLLDSQITIPAGYTLVSPLGQTTLGFRESTTFTIELDADALGTYAGDLVVLSNDDNEGAYNLALTGEVSDTAVVDDVDSVFVTTGGWETHTDPPGALAGGFHYSDAGSGEDLANWTIPVAPARYQVWASWSASNNRATNSPFRLFDGTYQLTTQRRNQRLPADDISDDGVGWESLGVYDVTSNTLQVTLADDADGFVIADGIRLQRVGELAADANIVVSLGDTTVADDTGAVDFGATLLDAPLRQQFTVRNTGLLPLVLGDTLTVPDGFSVVSTFSATTLASGEAATFELQFDAAQIGAFSGDVHFTTNDPDSPTFNFAVSGVAAADQVIDNGQSGFATIGNWGTSSSPPGALNSTFRFSAPGSGADQASWTFDLPAGRYQVAASWSASANRATDAPYRVENGGVTLGTVVVNQRLAAAGFQDQGVWWDSLGEFDLDGSELVVTLDDDANNYVIADAIRVQRLDLPPSPQVTVSVDGQAVADGQSQVDYGATLLDSPLAKTFLVSNVGQVDLILGDTISVPAGFSLVTGFTTLTLPPGTSTSFVVQLDAAAAGAFGGTVSFTTNDAESAVFDFEVVGEVDTSLIIDDGDSGFAAVGDWTLRSNEGRDGDIQYSAAGVGDDVATWTAPLAPGEYSLAATWNAVANRATDAPFRIYDQDTLVATVRLNQELAPDDLIDDGSGWESLGTFPITSGMLRVTLADDADEYVIADGVRVERTGDLTLEPEIDVVVDGESLADGASSVDFGVTLAGAPVARQVVVRNIGLQDLELTESVAVPPGFRVLVGFDDLTLAPGEQASLQLQFDADAAGVSSGEVGIFSNDGDESPFQFQVIATATAVQIVDNQDSGFSTSGSWTHWLNEGYQDSIHFSAAGSGTDVASWSLSLPPGEYSVAATWNAVANRATNSPFTVLDGSQTLSTTTLNQELTPDDVTDVGVGWESLGSFNIVSGTLTVQLSDAADQYVIADAIRVERLAALPDAPQIELYENSQTLADGDTVNFGSTMLGSPAVREFLVRNSGLQPLQLDPSIVTPAGFSIASELDALTVAPGGTAQFSVRLNAVAEGDFSGQLVLNSNADNDGSLTIDLNGHVTKVQVIDNGEPGFSVVGSWGAASSPSGAYNDSFLYNRKGVGADTASWAFLVPSGQYRVSASWSASSNRATNAPFTILDGTTEVLASAVVNQKLPANDFSDAGVLWEDLGQVIVDGSLLLVRLSDQANNYVIADAIRIERILDGAAAASAGNGSAASDSAGGDAGGDDSAHLGAAEGAGLGRLLGKRGSGKQGLLPPAEASSGAQSRRASSNAGMQAWADDDDWWAALLD